MNFYLDAWERLRSMLGGGARVCRLHRLQRTLRVTCGHGGRVSLLAAGETIPTLCPFCTRLLVVDESGEGTP